MTSGQLKSPILMNEAIDKAATRYSKACSFRECAGSVAVIITTTAGTITVSQQCSQDGVTWYDPTDTAAGALGVVRTALEVTTGIYTPFTPVMCEYIRFKVVEANVATTTVTIRLIFRQEI